MCLMRKDARQGLKVEEPSAYPEDGAGSGEKVCSLESDLCLF